MTMAAMREAEFCILQLAMPGRPVRDVGVILFNDEQVALKLADQWEEFADEEYWEVLELTESHLRKLAEEMEPAQFVASLEDSLSNVFRLGARETVTANRLDRRLEMLFAKYVEGGRQVPLYAL